MSKKRTSSSVKNRWNKEHYKKVNIVLKKEDGDFYKKICEEKGMTMSEIPKKAILDFISDIKKSSLIK